MTAGPNGRRWTYPWRQVDDALFGDEFEDSSVRLKSSALWVPKLKCPGTLELEVG